MENLAYPMVHLNGTSKRELLDQLKDAALALRNAEKKLALSAPHMRDYYVQPNGNWNRARDQYEERMQKLDSMIRELEYIGAKIIEQGRD